MKKKEEQPANIHIDLTAESAARIEVAINILAGNATEQAANFLERGMYRNAQRILDSVNTILPFNSALAAERVKAIQGGEK